MSYDTEELIVDAIAEAWRIKELMPAERKALIDPATFVADSEFNGLYGQGDEGGKWSPDSIKLRRVCGYFCSTSTKSIETTIDLSRPSPSFTCLEYYLSQPGAQVETVLNYLKQPADGETWLTPEQLAFSNPA